MNSDDRRIKGRYDPYDRPNIYQAYYSPEGLRDRLRDPSFLVAIILVVLFIIYETASQQGRIPALQYLVWDFLVFAIPTKALYAVDHWLNRPLFPLPMLQTQSRTHEAKSDVLRRVLGMDKPGSLIMSVSQAGRRSLSGLSSVALGIKPMADRPPGLGNYDNSCYQNSILQSLSSLKSFPSYLSGITAEHEGEQPVVGTADALRNLIADLNDPSNNGRTLWTPGVLKNMSTWQQQDAQEYFSKLLDEIDKEIAKANRAPPKPPTLEAESVSDDTSASQHSDHSDDSGYQSLAALSKHSIEHQRWNRNPLEGLIAQRVACVACGHCEGLSMIPFNCVTLNLGIGRAEHDLYERLDNYSKVEEIQGVECAKCSLLKVHKIIKLLIERKREAGKRDEDSPELHRRLVAIEEALEEDAFDDKTLADKCKLSPQQRVTSVKTKQAVIARPPQSLVVHMNRSVFDENTGRMFKNLAAVRFPMTLDLGPWCLGSADKFTGLSPSEMGSLTEKVGELVARDEEQWLLEPKSSMVAGDLQPSKITGPIYELRAVITHFGQHENGHYVCYRRHTGVRGGNEEGDEKPPGLASNDHGDEVESMEGVELDLSLDEKAEGVEQRTTSLDEEPSAQWWRLSDQDVTRVEESTVLAQGGVFMLFYDCIDPNSLLVTDMDGLADGLPGRRGDALIQTVTMPAQAVTPEGLGRAVTAAAASQAVDIKMAAAVPLPEDEEEID
ncbi:ubiquitin carboxyl-terminal hydrolase [Lasiosphaeria hispida]|uniref:ubiquitinyl hydrolase 1 n=1 Tax=Lasiosphaeria hispida TaxID=260671 RepID=A0AAJ0HPU5_9PEZI|nr:ubiquitin carboxyl-terminal hydrolase [Lasiosphaeria hispida]